MSRRTLIAAAAGACAVAAAVLPGSADAARLTGSGFGPNTIELRANPGERNAVVTTSDLATSADDVTIRDVHPITLQTARGRCVQPRPTEVTCRSEEQLIVVLDDGDDTVIPGADARHVIHGQAGDDRALLGTRIGGGTHLTFHGGDGNDEASYALSGFPVRVSTAETATPDGRTRLLDVHHVMPDVEVLTGSRLGDELTGGPEAQVFRPGLGDDVVTGGGGADRYEMLAVADGADRVIGQGPSDVVSYALRPKPVSVSVNQPQQPDGEPGENDDVRFVGGVEGGAAGDQLSVAPAFVLGLPAGGHLGGGAPPRPGDFRLVGGPGDDTIAGGAGSDAITGGPGRDTVTAAGGTDFVRVRDGEADTVDCGAGTDFFDRDDAESAVTGCETDLRRFDPAQGERQTGVGRLSVARRALRATANAPVTLELAWRHPRAWRRLRDIRVELLDAGAPVASVSIDPRRARITGDGLVRLVRRSSRVRRGGRDVRGRLTVEPGIALAGRTLTADVVATDAAGRRQVEPRVATIRVAGV